MHYRPKVIDIRKLPSVCRFKSEVEKLADENTWVKIRTAAAEAESESLHWTLAASFGLDNVTPAVLLTIYTAHAMC